jgi:uncharacterized protein DUF742
VSVPRHDDWTAAGGLSGFGAGDFGPLSGNGLGDVYGFDDIGMADAATERGTAEERSSTLVRPYAVTGGRTKPNYHLQIEAMVAASHYEAHDLTALSPECQSILGFCRDWRSIAEISAVLRMPLGVARVLVGDMATDGLVRVHQAEHGHGRPDLNLLERVLSGLRRL